MELNVMDFIMEQSLILIPVLYILGLMLKNSKVKDYLIPWILLITGIGGSIALNGLNTCSVLQGVLVTGATVYADQLVKQTTTKRKEDIKENE